MTDDWVLISKAPNKDVTPTQRAWFEFKDIIGLDSLSISLNNFLSALVPPSSSVSLQLVETRESS